MHDRHLIRRQPDLRTFFQASVLLAGLAALVDRIGAASFTWSVLHG